MDDNSFLNAIFHVAIACTSLVTIVQILDFHWGKPNKPPKIKVPAAKAILRKAKGSDKWTTRN